MDCQKNFDGEVSPSHPPGFCDHRNSLGMKYPSERKRYLWQQFVGPLPSAFLGVNENSSPERSERPRGRDERAFFARRIGFARGENCERRKCSSSRMGNS